MYHTNVTSYTHARVYAHICIHSSIHTHTVGISVIMSDCFSSGASRISSDASGVSSCSVITGSGTSIGLLSLSNTSSILMLLLLLVGPSSGNSLLSSVLNGTLMTGLLSLSVTSSAISMFALPAASACV